ncbi:Uncharacterized protein Fot_07045 [Forsythia ovata]|uniref:Uncharacterized protein n=1 Tax=Forsythia ovata TaxID=205694 RepID=A0ABD1WUQ2_9LAMI
MEQSFAAQIVQVVVAGNSVEYPSALLNGQVNAKGDWLVIHISDFWLLIYTDGLLHLPAGIRSHGGQQHLGRYYFSIQGAKLVIDTPNLEFFEYRGQETEFHFVKELKSLARAEISFISKVQDHDKVSEFINKMRGVKSLFLSYNAVEGWN